MEPPKPPPSKRMAPAPPVPAKTKPALGLPSKPSSPQPGASAELERGRAADPDCRRLQRPAGDHGQAEPPHGHAPPGAGPAAAQHGLGGFGAALRQALPPSPPAAQSPEQRLALEDLKAEVRSLHILVDLMRGQHLRDLEDVRLELQHERARREALQVSPLWPWDTRTPPQCPTDPPAPHLIPAGGDRAGEEGAALLAGTPKTPPAPGAPPAPE
nr:WAS/WASL-interacting protein family member 3-like [Anas platyrhynchos]